MYKVIKSRDFLIIQLVKRSESYDYIGKRFKFLAGLIQNIDTDEDNIKPIIMPLTVNTLMQNWFMSVINSNCS